MKEEVEVMEFERDWTPDTELRPLLSISSSASCTADSRVMASSTMFSLCRIHSISLACCLACTAIIKLDQRHTNQNLQQDLALAEELHNTFHRVMPIASLPLEEHPPLEFAQRNRAAAPQG